MSSNAIDLLREYLKLCPRHEFTASEVWELIGTDWDKNGYKKYPILKKDIDIDEYNLDKIIKETLVSALMITNYVQKDAAELLGISPRATNYKCKQYGIKHYTWKKNR